MKGDAGVGLAQRRPLPCASCTRFSPNKACPAAISGAIASASCILAMAISCTDPAVRRATFSACDMPSRTADRRTAAAFISSLCPFIGAAIRGAMRQGQGKIPSIWLMTDERVGDADLLRAVDRLPRGSAVIFRHYSLPERERRALFGTYQACCAPPPCPDIIGGRSRAGAGLARGRPPWPRRQAAPRPLRLAAQRAGPRSSRTCRGTTSRGRMRCSSHRFSPPARIRGANALGPSRFAALTRQARVPAIALGGVKKRHAALVRMLSASGYAAIDGLSARPATTSS